MSSSFYDDGEDELDSRAEAMIMRAVRPPAPAEANMLSKKRRYATWATDPEQMAADVHAYYNTVAYLQRGVRQSEAEEQRWFETYEFARSRLKSSLEACKNENKRLASDSKMLQEMCKKEMGHSSVSRKKKTSLARDLVYELDYRKGASQDLIAEYEELMEEIGKKVTICHYQHHRLCRQFRFICTISVLLYSSLLFISSFMSTRCHKRRCPL